MYTDVAALSCLGYNPSRVDRCDVTFVRLFLLLLLSVAVPAEFHVLDQDGRKNTF